MLIPVLLALALPGDSVRAYSGQARNLNVQLPRIEASVTIDGKLEEPVWASAARLTIDGTSFGAGVSPGQDRNLWVHLSLPLLSSTSSQHRLGLNVSATTP